MYKQMIKNYVEKIKKEDIIKFIENNNYIVSDKEIDIIYFYIKNYWEEVFNNNTEIWERLKRDVCPNTYVQIMNLYNKYKKFIV